MTKYIENAGTLFITDMLANEVLGHKGVTIDTLIVTRRVWEDTESRVCLQPMLWRTKTTKAKIIIVNEDGKFEILT